MSQNQETHGGVFEICMRCLFAVLFFIPAAVSWLIDRSEYFFGFLLATCGEVGGFAGKLLRILPFGLVGELCLMPFFILGSVAKQAFEGLAERSEWLFGSLTMISEEVAGFLGQLLCLLPWHRLEFIIRPFAMLYFAAHERLSSLFELSEWLTGEITFALIESFSALFKLLLMMPLMALIRLSRSLLPDQLVDVFFDSMIGLPDFVSAWTTSRDSWKLLFATPSLLLAVPVIVCLTISMGNSAGDKTARYRMQLTRAIAVDNQAVADLCVARLNQLGYQRREQGMYRAALLVDSRLGPDAAYDRIHALAVDGYAPARIWIASYLLTDCAADETNKVGIARDHLTLAIADEPRLITAANHILAESYVLTGDVRLAAATLAAIPKPNQATRARMMELSLALGDRTTAKRNAVEFSSGLSNEADAVFTMHAYLRMAKAHVINGDHTQLKWALQRCVQEYPACRQDKQFALLFTLGISQSQSIAEVLYEFDNTNVDVLDRLAQMIVSNPDNIRPFIKKRLAEGNLSAELFVIAGDKMALAEKFDIALTYYRSAAKLDVEHARSWNNMAWILSNIQHKHAAALKASNHALAIEANPDYHDTRGQILAHLGRWKEARADLELAVNGNLPDLESTHEMLAATYKALGMQKLALAYSATR